MVRGNQYNKRHKNERRDKIEERDHSRVLALFATLPVFIAGILTISNQGFLNILNNSDLPRPNLFAGEMVLSLPISLTLFFITIMLRKKLTTLSVLLIIFLSSGIYLGFDGEGKKLFIVINIFLILLLLKIVGLEKKNKVTLTPIFLILFSLILPLSSLNSQVKLLDKIYSGEGVQQSFTTPKSGISEYKVTFYKSEKEKVTTYTGVIDWSSCLEEGRGVDKSTEKLKYYFNKYYSQEKENGFVTDKSRVGVDVPNIFVIQPFLRIAKIDEVSLCRGLEGLGKISNNTKENIYQLDNGKLKVLSDINSYKILKEVYNVKGINLLTAFYNISYTDSLSGSVSDLFDYYAYFKIIKENGNLKRVELYLKDPRNPERVPYLGESITFTDSELKIDTNIKVKDITKESVGKGLF